MTHIKRQIYYDPNASITRIAINDLDPHGIHKLTKEEAEGIEELTNQYPDVKTFINFFNYDNDKFVNLINNNQLNDCFKDFRTCIRLYKSHVNFIYHGDYPRYYIFHFNKVYKDFVNEVFNYLNIKEIEDRQKFVNKVKQVIHTYKRYTKTEVYRGSYFGITNMTELNKLEEDIKKEKTPNDYFKKQAFEIKQKPRY